MTRDRGGKGKRESALKMEIRDPHKEQGRGTVAKVRGGERENSCSLFWNRWVVTQETKKEEKNRQN